MEKRIAKLKLIFYMPTVAVALRAAFTIWVFVANPQQMFFRYIQLVPLCVLIAYTFMYHKLFDDGVPVITLLVPTILHFLFVLLFKEVVQIVPFIAPLVLDCIYLAVKSVKASSFPFIIEGDEEDKLAELLSEVE